MEKKKKLFMIKVMKKMKILKKKKENLFIKVKSNQVNKSEPIEFNNFIFNKFFLQKIDNNILYINIIVYIGNYC